MGLFVLFRGEFFEGGKNHERTRMAEQSGDASPLRGSKQIYYNVNPRLAKPRPGLSSDRPDESGLEVSRSH